MSGYRWGATTGLVQCCWCGKMLPSVLTVPVPHECAAYEVTATTTTRPAP